MNDKELDLFARAMTECAVEDCPYVAIRMVVEQASEGGEVMDATMLCRRHSALYVPKGPVIWDKIMVSQENLTWMEQKGL